MKNAPILAGMLPTLWGMLAAMPELSQEQLNQAEAEAKELAARLEAQGEGNQALKADYEAQVAEVANLKTALETAQATIDNLTSQNTAQGSEINVLEEQLERYKAIVEEKQQGGKGLPEEDANSREGEAGVADYNADAVKAWRTRKGK